MAWDLEEAQHKFHELVSAASQEPQLIYQQDCLVAVVLEADLFQQFQTWQRQQQPQSLAHALAELRQICIEEAYSLEVPPRQDCANPFAESCHDLSV